MRLGDGQFFGEIALLRKTRRTANVRAAAPTKLLMLDAFDLQALIVRNPEIGDCIREVAEDRKGIVPEGQKGDLLAAELEQGSPQPEPFQ